MKSRPLPKSMGGGAPHEIPKTDFAFLGGRPSVRPLPKTKIVMKQVHMRATELIFDVPSFIFNFQSI